MFLLQNYLLFFQVLTLFWNLAHSTDVSIDIMDQALSAHVKILDYSCTQYREAQKMKWLDKCIEELKASPAWVLPALKQIREICCLYQVRDPKRRILLDGEGVLTTETKALYNIE